MRVLLFENTNTFKTIFKILMEMLRLCFVRACTYLIVQALLYIHSEKQLKDIKTFAPAAILVPAAIFVLAAILC